ncbi:RNA-binding protein [Mucilaginibacter sp. RS28]|uniref:RNA-binding protein n=1 Tax=Mucilaginibacter straminoryzae TaxID=2932774 RepID=A0A9X1X3G7_9SPHI|nr:RNA-binding protein [Mucilaginibacter straminoryzae]MCJ8210517.1 RNA-binding protein [Mucilaginibacter straminoryzae]
MNIFVASLPFNLREEHLRELFEAYGEVSSAKLIMDRETGKSKGFGFVEMDDEEGQKAIEGLNGMQVSGRAIAVSQAEDRKPSGNRTGGGFGGGNRGGGFNRGGGAGGSRNSGGYGGGGGQRGNRY